MRTREYYNGVCFYLDDWDTFDERVTSVRKALDEQEQHLQNVEARRNSPGFGYADQQDIYYTEQVVRYLRNIHKELTK